jgi:hypothetical protein
MAKTVNDYMNDPRILEDQEMMEAPECIREIHAIRLKLQDETEGMTTEEHVAYINQKGKAILARWGLLHLYTDLTNKKTAPLQMATPLEVAISEPILAVK